MLRDVSLQNMTNLIKTVNIITMYKTVIRGLDVFLTELAFQWIFVYKKSILSWKCTEDFSGKLTKSCLCWSFFKSESIFSKVGQNASSAPLFGGIKSTATMLETQEIYSFTFKTWKLMWKCFKYALFLIRAPWLQKDLWIWRTARRKQPTNSWTVN